MNAQVIKVYTFDNFSSRYIQLVLDLDKLDKKCFRATGIMRKDHVMKSPLIDIEQMKRNKESHDYRSDRKIKTVRWNDNSAVTLISNRFSVEPIRTVTCTS